MTSTQKLLTIVGTNDIIIEESVDNTECQNAVVYLSSNHKQTFLRIINAERNFIKSEFVDESILIPLANPVYIFVYFPDPELYPELVSIMATELNEVGDVERNESDWLQIMNAWINGVKDDYQTIIRSK